MCKLHILKKGCHSNLGALIKTVTDNKDKKFSYCLIGVQWRNGVRKPQHGKYGFLTCSGMVNTVIQDLEI